MTKSRDFSDPQKTPNDTTAPNFINWRETQLGRLANELVLLGIFAHLSPKDIWRSRTVSKIWLNFTQEEVLWRAVCHMQYTPSVWKPDERSWEWVCRSKSINICTLNEKNEPTANLAEGIVGFFISPDGIKFEGDWAGGSLHGYGMRTLVNGEVYKGQWQKGSSHGQGILLRANNYRYEGDWVDGQRHGWGCHRLGNESYIGEWRNDKKEGWGIIRPLKDHLYDGEFKNDQRNGFGSYTFEDGQKCIGFWKDGKRHSKGYYFWTDGRKYFGDWKQSWMDGQGTYTWPDGATYQGGWLKHKRHGRGRMVWADGTIYDGEWNQDIRAGGSPEQLEWDRFFQKSIAEQHEFMRQYIFMMKASQKKKVDNQQVETLNLATGESVSSRRLK